jgi:hypothetical protein
MEKDCTVKDALDAKLLFPFRRTLRGLNLAQWNAIKEKLSALNLSTDNDFISWSLNQNNIFSTKSMYHWLERNLAGSHNKWIWKAKIPLKIKIFLWQMCQDAVLTRENMKKKELAWIPVCSFCNHLETNDHLFFNCPISRVVWGSG